MRNLFLIFLVLIIIGCSNNNIEETAVGNISTETNQEIKNEPVYNASSIDLKYIPESIEKNCIGFVIGSPFEIQNINLVGGAWARPHPGPFAWEWVEPKRSDFDFSETDEWVRKAQEYNVSILGTIWPYASWDQKTCHTNECKVSEEDTFYSDSFRNGIPSLRCVPCNYDDYSRFVSRLVERYDGDSFYDMPGLDIPIKNWEILNEPEMKEKTLTFYKGTREELLVLMEKSYEAIKSSCSDCNIIQAGAAGIEPEMLGYWAEIFNKRGYNYFDIANIHYINNGDFDTLNVKDFKDLMKENEFKKPIWVTEAEYSSETDVKFSINGSLSAGASKIFFTQFVIGQTGIPKMGRYSKVYENIIEICK